MTPDDATDQIVGMLARLPSAAPRVEHEDLVRARCRAALDTRSQRKANRERRASIAGRTFDVAFVAAMCIYLAAAVGEAWWLVR